MPSPPDTSARLNVRDVHKRFGPRTVLDGVDLHVEAGSVVLLAGTNGSGKTTLLRCIAGLAEHDGRVAIDGQPWRGRRSDRRRIGYLPQSLGLPEWATVDEVLGLFARLRGLGSAVDLPELPDGFLPPGGDRIDVLSGGQRQRVAIAVALLGAPPVLLLDEPAANLDDEGRADLFAVLAGERDRGASIVVAAPSPGDLNGLPDRTVRLLDGRIQGGRPSIAPAPSDDDTTVAIDGGARIPEEVAS